MQSPTNEYDSDEQERSEPLQLHKWLFVLRGQDPHQDFRSIQRRDGNQIEKRKDQIYDQPENYHLDDNAKKGRLQIRDCGKEVQKTNDQAQAESSQYVCSRTC